MSKEKESRLPVCKTETRQGSDAHLKSGQYYNTALRRLSTEGFQHE